MGVAIPDIPRAEFARLLARAVAPGSSHQALDDVLVERLHTHYSELRRWNTTVALVGPAFANEAISEHYAESLAGADLLPAGPAVVLDIGSGAGFPGLILAAARPDLDMVLLESRERKCAFLRSATRRMGLQARCLNARLGTPPPQGLPESIAVVTVRAVRIESTLLLPLLPRLSAGARVLLWATEPPPDLLGLALRDERQLTGGRRILAYETPS